MGKLCEFPWVSSDALTMAAREEFQVLSNTAAIMLQHLNVGTEMFQVISKGFILSLFLGVVIHVGIIKRQVL